VVAADTGLRASLARWLLGAGYVVELAESSKRAREVVAGEYIPLAVVEADGLGPDGAELVSHLPGSVGRVILIGEPMAHAVGRVGAVRDNWIQAGPGTGVLGAGQRSATGPREPRGRPRAAFRPHRGIHDRSVGPGVPQWRGRDFPRWSVATTQR